MKKSKAENKDKELNEKWIETAIREKRKRKREKMNFSKMKREKEIVKRKKCLTIEE